MRRSNLIRGRFEVDFPVANVVVEMKGDLSRNVDTTRSHKPHTPLTHWLFWKHQGR